MNYKLIATALTITVISGIISYIILSPKKDNTIKKKAKSRRERSKQLSQLSKKSSLPESRNISSELINSDLSPFPTPKSTTNISSIPSLRSQDGIKIKLKSPAPVVTPPPHVSNRYTTVPYSDIDTDSNYTDDENNNQSASMNMSNAST